MRDATPEVLAAVRAHLLSVPAIASAVGQRISTDWALPLEAPFIRLQVPTVAPFEDDCAGQGSTYAVHVHVFGRTGAAAHGALVDNVTAALDDAALTLATSSLWWIMHTGTVRHTDPGDPQLTIARIAFDAATTGI